jgi:peptidase E
MANPTTYILAGGEDLKVPGYGERICKEMLNHADRPKILSCFFSAPEAEWETKYQRWKSFFANYLGNFTLDYAKKDTFLKQVDAADVIYLHGGDTKLLLDSLPPVDTLKERFKGKLVIGSSAGANVLATNYWSSSRAVPNRGLGLVNANIMVHYGTLNHEKLPRTPAGWEREEAEFQSFIGDGKITRIPEGTYISFLEI